MANNHVMFPTDDGPETGESSYLHVLGSEDYYVWVGPRDQKFSSHAFRACTSGARNHQITFLIAALYFLGNGRLKQAISAAHAFIDEANTDLDHGIAFLPSFQAEVSDEPIQVGTRGVLLTVCGTTGTEVQLRMKIGLAEGHVFLTRDVWERIGAKKGWTAEQPVTQTGQVDTFEAGAQEVFGQAPSSDPQLSRVPLKGLTGGRRLMALSQRVRDMAGGDRTNGCSATHDVADELDKLASVLIDAERDPVDGSTKTTVPADAFGYTPTGKPPLSRPAKFAPLRKALEALEDAGGVINHVLDWADEGLSDDQILKRLMALEGPGKEIVQPVQTKSWWHRAIELVDALEGELCDGARTGSDVLHGLRSWLLAHPSATTSLALFQDHVYGLIKRHEWTFHKSGCKVLGRVFAATFEWETS